MISHARHRPTELAPATNTPERRVVELVNAERARHGLRPVQYGLKLSVEAGMWARIMANYKGLSHGNFAARADGYFPGHSAGECIAYGQDTPEAVVDAWMSDEPHRDILLGDFAEAGVGRVLDREGRPYWCLDMIG